MKNIGGIHLEEEEFTGLIRTHMLTREVIDASLATSPDVAASNGLTLLSFDSYFCNKMYNVHPTIGFKK